jgi:4'-phosphopantetheinyl transferase
MLTANQRHTSWPLRVEPLRYGSVDVWCISLSTMERRLESLSALLSDEEIRKARAYRFDHHRRRFCIARGTLRALLGEYLQCSPRSLPLERGPGGKPTLAMSIGRGVHFNVSHSADVVLYGFSPDAEVGADIEYLDRTLDRDLVVNRAFTQTELEAYYATDVKARLSAFFQLWARKEARLKARGLRMAQLSADAIDGIPVADFNYGEDYVGAVAVDLNANTAAASKAFVGTAASSTPADMEFEVIDACLPPDFYAHDSSGTSGESAYPLLQPL